MIMKLLTSIILLMATVQLTAQTTTWYEIPSGTDKKMNTISFGSDMVGYIGGNDSLLLKTTDGGQNWSPVSFSGVTFLPSGEHIVNLKFINATIGYMTVGPYTGTYKTTDGGSTWSEVTLAGNMCYNQGLYFWDENNGIIGGSGCFQGELISVMSNGTISSATMNDPTFNAADIVLDLDFHNALGLGVSRGRFVRSTDNGLTWDTISSGITYELTSIEIVDDTLAYAGYIDTNASGFGLLVTHDAGLTWSMEMSMATFYYPDYNDVYETANGYLYAGGETSFQNKGMLFDHKGNGWWYYEVDHPVHAINSYGDSTVFAVGDSGLIVTNVNPATLGISHTHPSQVHDFTPYLNPAQTHLNLAYTDTDFDVNPEVVIWNLQGQMAYQTILTQKIIPVENLTPGIYVLELRFNNEIIRQKFVKE